MNLKGRKPVTPFYFWPQNDAWKQLKLDINSKSWISEQERVRIMNYTSELMNYWKKNKILKTPKDITKQFQEIDVIGVS